MTNKETISEHGSMESPNDVRRFNRAKGSAGEAIAGNYLTAHGFQIVQYNYRKHGGEVDIIATKPIPPGRGAQSGEIVYHFIEVKMRTTDRFGTGREAVTFGKQKKIKTTAKLYMLENKLYDRVLCCFDVIEIHGGLDSNTIEHLENCF
jgi:putative endonuclease